jgi:hypothetical protein
MAREDGIIPESSRARSTAALPSVDPASNLTIVNTVTK